MKFATIALLLFSQLAMADVLFEGFAPASYKIVSCKTEGSDDFLGVCSFVEAKVEVKYGGDCSYGVTGQPSDALCLTFGNPGEIRIILQSIQGFYLNKQVLANDNNHAKFLGSSGSGDLEYGVSVDFTRSSETSVTMQIVRTGASSSTLKRENQTLNLELMPF